MAAIRCAFESLLSKDKFFNMLKNYYQSLGRHMKMRRMFQGHPDRAKKFNIELEKEEKEFSLLFDFSKNISDEEAIKIPLELAKSRGVEGGRHMVSGANINLTEVRTALPGALRDQANEPILVDGRGVMSNVNRVPDKMEDSCDSVISDQLEGYMGREITEQGMGAPNMPVARGDILKLYKSCMIYINGLKYSDQNYLKDKVRQEFRQLANVKNSYDKGKAFLERDRFV